jgi:hypothetical protein
VHYDTELELMQQHLAQGDEVMQLYCNAQLAACDANSGHFLNDCLRCTTRRSNGTKLLTHTDKLNTRSFLQLTPQNKADIAALPTRFDSLKTLQNCTIENFDIGYAVASSVVTATRNPDVDVYENHLLTYRYLTSAAATYYSIKNYIAQNPTDIVYVFNGRFAQARAVYRACQQQKTNCYIHERGHTKNHYNISKNVLPHDFEYIQNRINQLWHAADPEHRAKLGAQYYTDRSKGVEQHWKSFIGDQQKDLLPQNWNAAQRNIVLFCSSEDEYVSLGAEYAHPFYADQLQGIKAIAASISNDKNMHLYLRIHPNMVDFDAKVLQKYADLAHLPNVTVIMPTSPISSYALMHSASVVITFGSVMGVEATFWGKAAILVGNITYRGLGAIYEPRSHAEVMELIYTPNLPPKPRENTLIFGYYMYSFGTPFEYFEADSVTEGKFKGIKINDGAGRWWAKATEKLSQIKIKNRSVGLLVGYVFAQKLVQKYGG